MNMREDQQQMNDYCGPNTTVFTPNQAMQVQFLSANITRANTNTNNKQKQKFKKAPPQPPYTVLAAANKGKLLHTITKNNVVFTESMLMQNNRPNMPVS